MKERNQDVGWIMEKSTADKNLLVRTGCKFMFPGEGLNSWWHAWDN